MFYCGEVLFWFGFWVIEVEVGFVVYIDMGVGGVVCNDIEVVVQWVIVQFEVFCENVDCWMFDLFDEVIDNG